MITKPTAKEASSKRSAAKVSRTGHGRSPKIQALLNLIDMMDPDEKGVIFSQWTRVLKLVEEEFLRLGHTYVVISGEKSANERIDAMMAFDTERCDSRATPRFMLCSLMACGTGINLTRGNVVFMMDTWWNQAAENQAMDRVHRIGYGIGVLTKWSHLASHRFGTVFRNLAHRFRSPLCSSCLLPSQTRPVRVYRLVMKDSIEERMIRLQNNKLMLAKGSIEKFESEDEKKQARLTALKDLFEITQDDGVWA
jgi:SNF2 family DNA or RNA helicase